MIFIGTFQKQLFLRVFTLLSYALKYVQSKQVRSKRLLIKKEKGKLKIKYMYITEHILIKINITYLKSSRNVVHSRFVQFA